MEMRHKTEMHERVQSLWCLTGKSYTEIALELGISRQRVGQIMSNFRKTNYAQKTEKTVDKTTVEKIGLDIEAMIKSMREKARQLRRDSDRMNRARNILEDIVKKRDLRKEIDQEKTLNER